MRPEKLVEFLEAVYALELDDETWLRMLGATSRDVWGRPAAFNAYLYDASDLAAFRPMRVVMQDVSEELATAGNELLAFQTPPLVARLYRRFVAGTLRREAPEMLPGFVKTEPLGMADTLSIVGCDPNGLGCAVSIIMAVAHELKPAELSIYRRMAFHLGAAFRARQRLRLAARNNASVDLSAGAEAVIDTSGKILHAEGPAKTRAAGESLKGALRAFDQARSREANRDPITGMERHRPLVDARWTLVDAYEKNGSRYVVARENEAEVSGLATLSARERQVAAFLALGRTTKEIAYSLGISDSTTRVLLSRATTKLRVRSRQELVDLVTGESLPGLAESDPSTRGSTS
jgi:DNA-binding CsgD family transcriptional regulator